MLLRKANKEDKDKILEMTKNTWDDGDYIKNVFDKWIEAPGEFTILVDKGEIVGCTKLSITKPNSLWLEGIRVAPNKRRKGYAKVLADYQLNLCQEIGFDHLNLSTWYQNESVPMLKNYPFEIINKYKVLTYDSDEKYNNIFDSKIVVDEVYKYFKTLYETQYYSCDWTFFTLDEYMIKVFLDRGEIYKHGSDYIIISDLHNKENSLTIVYLHHVDEEFISLINHVKQDKNKDYIMTMNDDEDMVKSLIDKGFEAYDNEEFDVYLYEYREN